FPPTDHGDGQVLRVELTPCLTTLYDVDLPPATPLAEHKFPRRIMRATYALRARHLQLSDVGAEQSAPCPINRHFHLAQKSGHFSQISAAPQKPCRQAGEMESENLRDRIVMADGCHHPQRLEAEWVSCLILEHTSQVHHKLLCLAHGKLCGWRTRLAIPPIGDAGAVADGPDVRRA